MLEFTPISELNSSQKPWKIRALISRIWDYYPRDKPGVILGMEIICVDEKGDRIQASVKQKMVQKFKTGLKEGDFRDIMNFEVLPNNGDYTVYNNENEVGSSNCFASCSKTSRKRPLHDISNYSKLNSALPEISETWLHSNFDTNSQNSVYSNEIEVGSSKCFASSSKTSRKRPLKDISNSSHLNISLPEISETWLHSNFNTNSQNSVYSNVSSSRTFASSSQVVSNHFVNENSNVYEDYGDATWKCEHCNALMWYNERINKRRKCIPPKFSMCCMHGKVELPPPPKLPQVLIDLLFGETSESSNFIHK